MKKLLAIITILITLFLCACTPNNAPNQTPTPPASQQPGEVTPTPYLVADPTPEAVDPKQMYVAGSNVNVRSEANTTSSVLTALKRNTVVTAYQQKNGWYYIEYTENKFGYMSAQYLSDEKYIATAEEQLEMMSEFDLYKNMPEYLDLMSKKRFFTVTDLNQNGRLELILVSTATLKGGDPTSANIYEIDENYSSLKKCNSLSGDIDNFWEDGWPYIIEYKGSVYIKDNKYYYSFSNGGYRPSNVYWYLLSFSDYKPISKYIGQFEIKEILNEGANEFDYEYAYYNANDEKITKEEYDNLANLYLPGSTEKEFSIHWEIVETKSAQEQPLYNYKKATPAQRLIALKKSYEGFAIK